MNQQEIENTPWAKEFKLDSPVSYKEAIEIAVDPDSQFELFKTNESGETQWVITPFNSRHTGFWMDAKKTKKEALALCREMGWEVVE